MRSAAALLILLATSEGASAHAFAQRYDLPLPLWHYLVGAGATVALSFVVAALFLRGGADGAREWRISLSEGATRIAETSLRMFGTSCFVALLIAGFFGEQGDWDSNLLPVTVWVIWWVGLTFAVALIGNIWPLIDPWRSIGLWLFGARERDCPALRRVGMWPAVFCFLAFSWAELAWTENAVPRKLAGLILFWSLVTWTGMALTGVESWRRHCDPFANFFALFGHFAPLTASRNGTEAVLIIRPWGAGLSSEPPPATLMAFILLTLATVAFDGLGETPFWERIAGLLVGWLYEAGLVAMIGYAAAGSLIKTFGLVVIPLVFAAIYLGICAITARLSGETAMLVARRYVLSLVPIAIAYHLAHYLSYLLVQGQAILPLLSDPFGQGWNLFGARERPIDIGIIDAEFVWITALLSIVTGHVIAVVLAHREALKTASPVLAAQHLAPLTALMIAYTMLSLWILSQPIVEVS